MKTPQIIYELTYLIYRLEFFKPDLYSKDEMLRAYIKRDKSIPKGILTKLVNTKSFLGIKRRKGSVYLLFDDGE